MKKFEFIQYIPTPDETKCLGIAEVRMYFIQEEHERFPTYGVERFKVMKNEKGGWYFLSASVKFPEEMGGYKPSFYLDSNEIQGQLYELIRIGIKEQVERKKRTETSLNVQGNQNYNPNNQTYQSRSTPPGNQNHKEKEESYEDVPF